MNVICYVTCKSEREAHKIAKALLKKRLVGCANIVPRIHSFYWWKGKILEEEPESLLLLKTTKGKEEKIIREIKKIHSYSVPCIEFLEVKKASREYSAWLGRETRVKKHEKPR